MLKSIPFLILLVAASSCSHAPMEKSDNSLAQQDGSPTTIEIHYVLRHSDRKITIESDSNGVHGKSLVDGAQLKQCQIDATRYQDFIGKVKNFISQRRSIASTNSTTPPTDCRAPYTILLKNQKDTTQIQGCRTQDEGAFSHLVQEGEFLIYRQK